ncbi:MAG: hypothetical protein EOP47_19745 [Sphingobacteriaceae bacterium]|nr:MAG: hypothetical protein EOP47_19745 [Sphingobacteriaceae bacterium]
MKKFLLICFAIFTIAVITSCKKSGNNPKPQPDPDPIPVVVDSLKVGLIAYYPFNNNGIDSSGHDNNVTVTSNIISTANRFSKSNSALSFNGTDSYLSVKDNEELRLNNTDVTVSLWVRIDGYNGSVGSNLLAKHIAGADNGWTMGIGGTGGTGLAGNITFGPGGGSVHARGTQFVSMGEWHMLTTTYDKVNKKLSIYLDGVLDNITESMPSPNGAITSDLYIGINNCCLSR